jgi:biopolymer transport protein ExbB/TolQ
MNAQFGLLNVWSQGDVVTRGVFVVLLVMSLASWIVILLKALDLRRLGQQALAATRKLLARAGLRRRRWTSWETTTHRTRFARWRVQGRDAHGPHAAQGRQHKAPAARQPGRQRVDHAQPARAA